MTVTTVRFLFCFVFTRDLYNTHYITSFMAHSFYVFLEPPIVVGVLLTCQSLVTEYKTTVFFQMFFQEKNIILSIWYFTMCTECFTCVCVGVNCSALCVFYVRTAAAVHITQWSPDGEYFATAGKVPPPPQTHTHTHTHSVCYTSNIEVI